MNATFLIPARSVAFTWLSLLSTSTRTSGTKRKLADKILFVTLLYSSNAVLLYLKTGSINKETRGKIIDLLKPSLAYKSKSQVLNQNVSISAHFGPVSSLWWMGCCTNCMMFCSVSDFYPLDASRTCHYWSSKMLPYTGIYPLKARISWQPHVYRKALFCKKDKASLVNQ